MKKKQHKSSSFKVKNGRLNDAQKRMINTKPGGMIVDVRTPVKKMMSRKQK